MMYFCCIYRPPAQISNVIRQSFISDVLASVGQLPFRTQDEESILIRDLLFLWEKKV